jgi:hypothetical protein
MAVMDYRTRDELADYGFSIEYQPGKGWRIYLIFSPVPFGRDDSQRLPYQSIDEHGRRYVDWPGKLDSLGDAKTVAALWAELVQAHRRTQEQKAIYGELIEHHQRTQQQRKTTISSADYFDDGTIVQQIRFGVYDLAVLDVSPEVSTVNWTASVSARGFISQIDRIADLAENDPVFLQIAPSRTYEIMVSSLRRLARDEVFNKSCEFIRIDLSATQSVAWQILPQEDHRLIVVGMGEQTDEIAAGDNREFLAKLLSATATSRIDSQEIISSLARLTEVNNQDVVSLVGRLSTR